MPERIRVEYSRKLSAQSNGEYNTEQLGAGWEFEVEGGADFQSEYERGFAVVKLTVDNLFKSMNGHRAESTESRATTLPGEKLSREPVRDLRDAREDRETDDSKAAIVEGQEYEFSNARVWKVEEARTARGKRYAKVRIGSRDQIPGGGYATVKSYNPVMISKMLALQEEDHVDVRGVFEGWDGREGRMYDFNPIEIERVRDVRSD